MPDEQPEWEHCECAWMDIPDADLLCGCGQHITRPYRDTVVHWRGKHWTLTCAFGYAVNLLDHLRMADIMQAEASIEYERQQPPGG